METLHTKISSKNIINYTDTSKQREENFIHKILDETYFDLLIENTLAKNFEEGYDITRINDRHSVIHMPENKFSMCILGRHPYHTFPSIYTLSSMISLEKSGVTSVRNNPNLALLGQGILVGFVDTGIDYQHEAFLNMDGSTRLFSIWDQTIVNGTPPPRFGFGAEYSKTQINIALREDNPLTIVPSTDEDGHGTMLAGIAAGNPNPEKDFSGAAPETELVVVKLAPAKYYNRKIFGINDTVLCYAETNILLGVEYILSVAQRLNRPVVICIGVGSSQGDHDGHDALAMYLNSLSTIPRVAVCVAGGNEGNARRHYRGEAGADRVFTNFELSIGKQDKDFSMQIWQKSPGRLAMQLQSPFGEWTEPMYPKFNTCVEYDFVFEPSRAFINNIMLEEETGEQLILLRFENAVSGIWNIRIITIDNLYSQFDAWLPSGNLISDETFFLESNPNVTISAPGNARNPLTVSAYNQTDGSILISSSRGFTASGGVTPDIAAPGFKLTCPVPGNLYGNATGTGAAAAHSTGIIAILLEWAVLRGNYTTISGRDINRLLIRGAVRRDNIAYPNPIWGYGIIDLFGTFRSLT